MPLNKPSPVHLLTNFQSIIRKQYKPQFSLITSKMYTPSQSQYKKHQHVNFHHTVT